MSSFPYLDGAGTNVGFTFRRVKDRESPPKLAATISAGAQQILAAATDKLALSKAAISECKLPVYNVVLTGADQPYVYFPYAGRWKIEIQSNVSASAAGTLKLGLAAPAAVAIAIPLGTPIYIPGIVTWAVHTVDEIILAAPTALAFFGEAIAGNMTLSDETLIRVTYLGVA